MAAFDDFTPELREQYLGHIRNGMRRGAAGETLGLERWVALGYIQQHPEFEARVIDAEDEAIEHIEEAIYQSAASGNFPAAKLWLERTENQRKRRQAKVADILEREDSGSGASEAIDDELSAMLKEMG